MQLSIAVVFSNFSDISALILPGLYLIWLELAVVRTVLACCPKIIFYHFLTEKSPVDLWPFVLTSICSSLFPLRSIQDHLEVEFSDVLTDLRPLPLCFLEGPAYEDKSPTLFDSIIHYYVSILFLLITQHSLAPPFSELTWRSAPYNTYRCINI